MARKCLQISYAQPLPLLWHFFLHKYHVQILFQRSTKRVRLSVDIESFWTEGYAGKTLNSGHELAIYVL